jgi:transcriptional regulator with XRE-family HTH domain
VNIREIRKNNLASLLGNYPNKERFAAALDIKASYLYQLLNGLRPISEDTARKFEAALKLPHNWLDQDSGTNQDNGIAEPTSIYNKGRYIYTKQEIDLINNFNSLMPEQKTHFFDAIAQAAEKNKEDFKRLKQIYGETQ